MKISKILAALTLLVAGSAFAQGYAGFEFSEETKRSDDSTKGKVGVVVGVKAAGGMDYSIKVENSQAQLGDGDIGAGAEVRVRKSFAALTSYNIVPYVGVRLGDKIGKDEHFSHYALDYGIRFPVVGKVVYLDLGGRHRNAFDTANEFRSNRYHALVGYRITDKDTVGVRYSQSYGDVAEEKNAWRLSYTRSF